ncbi:hypothetical protein GWO43_15380 [candidate division KSB1 bacterium]|nr:hypothetical protein [candidate division KSB1 bacterium]NIR68372.1 hypothetical protein [candidate division KSB1 bacterium]NIS25316.1 hypothetical protein [candidate division KSB1 bacterium]NIT72227.1 hypothetical protein [candidate division KSB1 bacterium]NIU26035.1 hypothetical protein [candidate division KSB1 bacterium]
MKRSPLADIRDILDFKFNAILIFYLLLGSILIYFYRYQISPDSISYISLTQKYLRGDFANAINGCWAPLYSWLLIPLLAVGFEPLLASVILTVFFGMLILMATRLLSRRFSFPENISTVILIALVPAILSYALNDSPPDFFVILFLLLYFNVIFDKDYTGKKLNGILCGVYASLAYFSKAYALPFFILHFLLFNIIHYHKASTGLNKKNVLRNCVYGFLVFFFINGPWIALISVKYDRVTFSTAGKFNYLASGPESKSKGGPYYYEGLFPPTNETAVSAWEDPTYHQMPEWSPLESWSLFKYQLKLIVRNSKKNLQKFQSFSSLSRYILFFYFLMALVPLRKLISKDIILYPLLTLILYCSGYIVMVVESRYLWVNAVLLILMGGHLIRLLLRSGHFNKLSQSLLILFFAATFVLPASKYLRANVNTKKDVYQLGKKLEKDYGIHGNIAANKHYTTMYIAYHIGAQYFGQVKPNQTAEEIENELNTYDIDYYFVWQDSNEHPAFLSAFPEVTNGNIPGLRIYALKDHVSSSSF